MTSSITKYPCLKYLAKLKGLMLHAIKKHPLENYNGIENWVEGHQDLLKQIGFSIDSTLAELNYADLKIGDKTFTDIYADIVKSNDEYIHTIKENGKGYYAKCLAYKYDLVRAPYLDVQTEGSLEEAFICCYSLRSANIGDVSKVTTFKGCFCYCTSLEMINDSYEFTIPDGVPNTYMFYNCGASVLNMSITVPCTVKPQFTINGCTWKHVNLINSELINGWQYVLGCNITGNLTGLDMKGCAAATTTVAANCLSQTLTSVGDIIWADGGYMKWANGCTTVKGVTVRASFSGKINKEFVEHIYDWKRNPDDLTFSYTIKQINDLKMFVLGINTAKLISDYPAGSYTYTNGDGIDETYTNIIDYCNAICNDRSNTNLGIKWELTL